MVFFHLFCYCLFEKYLCQMHQNLCILFDYFSKGSPLEDCSVYVNPIVAFVSAISKRQQIYIVIASVYKGCFQKCSYLFWSYSLTLLNVEVRFFVTATNSQGFYCLLISRISNSISANVSSRCYQHQIFFSSFFEILLVFLWAVHFTLYIIQAWSVTIFTWIHSTIDKNVFRIYSLKYSIVSLSSCWYSLLLIVFKPHAYSICLCLYNSVQPQSLADNSSTICWGCPKSSPWSEV